MRKSVEGATFLAMATAVAVVSGGMAFALGTSGPSRATELIAQARSGQTIVLPAGTTGTLTIANRRFDPAIRINASAATLSGIVIRTSSGIIIDRGTVVGPGGRSYGIQIDRSQRIGITNMTLTGAHRAIVLNKSQDITLTGNLMRGIISDGIDVAQSQRVLVQNNECRDFNPTPAVYSADGKTIIRDGDHADCIQGWSRPDFAATSDVRIIGNRVNGNMQGVFFGNHVRNGVDDGGFDRITISNNVVVGGSPHGISLYSARDSSVTNNRISTMAGARLERPPFNSVTSTLRIVDPTRVSACGNSVVNAPRGTPGLTACR